jgi:tyrosyl-DNA phosphodiesterase 1
MGGDPRRDGRPSFRLTEILGNVGLFQYVYVKCSLVVYQKSDLAFAIISSFALDLPWIYNFFDPSTPVILVAHSGGGQKAVKNVLPNWIATMPFLRAGHGCQHMKVRY